MHYDALTNQVLNRFESCRLHWLENQQRANSDTSERRGIIIMEDKIKRRVEEERAEFIAIVKLMEDVPMYDDPEKWRDR